MLAITGVEERGAGTGMTGLGRATGVGLGKTGKDDRDADSLGRGGAIAGEIVDEHSARLGAPGADLMGASAEPRPGALFTTGETRAGTLPNFGGDETRVGVPTGGDAKILACVTGNLGRVDTTLVLGNNVEFKPGVPVS